MKQEERNDLMTILGFVERWVERRADAPSEDGGSDAERLARAIPSLRKAAERRPCVRTVEKMVEVPVADNAAVYEAERRGRESVNPNYKYCVVDSGITRCGLTDGIGDAMEEAARRSITEGPVYVLSVRKSGDGSYRTHREGTCDGGHYEDTAPGVFLHYAYIAEKVGEDGIYKINNTQI